MPLIMSFGRILAKALLLLGAACAQASDDRVFEAGFLHVNDVYQIAPIDPREPRGGLARLATVVADTKRRTPGTLFVFGGDTLSPSVESGLFRGRQMMQAWNALAVDLAVPGNHEFDFGEAVLRERLSESEFPWLAANLEAEPPLPGIRKSELREINGARIGIVGLLTPETTTLSKPGPNIRFTPLIAAARREVEALRAAGAEAIVGLTHNTMEEDRELANSGLFDLILGGHDHHLIAETVGRTPILKAGSDVRDAIHARLRFSVSGNSVRLLGVDWEIIPVDGRIAEDERLLAIGRDVETRMEALLGQTIGETMVDLDARGMTLRRDESNIGNFAADAVREALGTDIALLNAGGFRSDRVIPKGAISRRDVMSLLPFQNPLLVLSISGSELRGVLEHGIGQRVERGQSGAMPQISGIRLAYDPNRPAGQRIISLHVGGRPVEAERRYTLTTSNYLAGGGDGYAALKTLPVLRPAEGSPVETTVIMEAIERLGRISPRVDGRLETVQ